MSVGVWAAWVVGAYVCGSTPFALLLGWLRGVDVRQVGSGNVGATNLGRHVGRRWGVLCFVLDVLKGCAPVFLAGLIGGLLATWANDELTRGDAWRWLAIGAAAVLGHVFPVWLGFKGGKGVATSFGVLLGYWPVLTAPAGAALAVWALIVKTTRYVGLASAGAAVALPLFVLGFGAASGATFDAMLPFIVVTALLAGLVVWRHRGNLARTFAGVEPKVGSKVKPSEGDERAGGETTR